MELDFIKKFINERKKLVDEQKARLEEVDDRLLANCKEYFLEHSNIKIGTHIKKVFLNYDGSSKENYYQVSKIEANVDGSIAIYGIKRKINKEFGKLEVYVTCSSVYDTSIPANCEIVEDK